MGKVEYYYYSRIIIRVQNMRINSTNTETNFNVLRRDIFLFFYTFYYFKLKIWFIAAAATGAVAAAKGVLTNKFYPRMGIS